MTESAIQHRVKLDFEIDFANGGGVQGQGLRLDIGIDSLNIDDTYGGARPVHTTLLGAGILIVEHLCNLERVPASGARFSAVPVKVKGMGSFPVRAYATVARA